MNFEFPLANGFTSMPGYSQLQGADLGRKLRTTSSVFADGVLRFMVTQNPDLNTQTFDPNDYSPEILEASRLLDATNPDISEFIESGGKLILLHGTVDGLPTPYGLIQYYNKLVDKFGQNALDPFVKFYLVPGYDHGRGTFTMSTDLLGALDNEIAPSNLVARKGI